MEFMLIMLTDRDTPMDPSIMPEMGKFAGELAAAGKIRGGSPLHPETDGSRIRGIGDSAVVTDGPFTETKEVIGGFFLIDCESVAEAVQIGARCPHNKIGFTEVRQVIPMGPPPQ